jgi:hypothetical protein
MDISQLTKLRNALLDVPCFKEEHKRKIVLDELISNYPMISIKSSDSITLAISLIKQCECYDGSFLCLISIMEALYEGQSKPLIRLQEVYMEIHNPSPDQPLLEKTLNEYVIHIVEINETRYIPLKFSELTDILLANTIIYTWKQIHTLCEVLVTDFMPTYKHIMNGQVPLAKTSIENFIPKCKKFADGLNELGSLDTTIFSFDRIESLKEIPYCIEPLLETMDYSPKTNYFILGQELAEHIINLLLEALRLADRILDSYLSPPTGT